MVDVLHRVSLQIITRPIQSQGIITRDNGARLRQHYPATYIHTAEEISYVDGCDPDGNRVLVAYPSPLQLPRSVITHRFR